MAAGESFNEGNAELLRISSAMVTSPLQAKMAEYRSGLKNFWKKEPLNVTKNVCGKRNNRFNLLMRIIFRFHETL
jgi:hypothetical protein